MEAFVVDEAGITELEPVTVVVAIGRFTQAKAYAIHTEIQALLDAYVPPQFRDGMVFHAMDLFNGKPFKGKEEFPVTSRLALIEAVLGMPRRYELSISYCRVNRAADAQGGEFPLGLSRCKWQQVRAHMGCITEANRQMQMLWQPGVLARVVCENGGGVRSAMNRAFNHLRENPAHLPPGLFRLDSPDVTPRTKLEGVSVAVDRIYGTPAFVRKDQEPMLQLADACAFTIRRWLSRQHFGVDLMRMMLAAQPDSLEIHSGPQSQGTWYPHLSPGFCPN